MELLPLRYEGHLWPRQPVRARSKGKKKRWRQPQMCSACCAQHVARNTRNNFLATRALISNAIEHVPVDGPQTAVL